MTLGKGVQHLSAAERALGSLVTQNKPVSAQGHDGCFQDELTEGGRTWRQGLPAVEDNDLADHLGGAEVHANPLVVLDLAPRSWPDLDKGVKALGGERHLGVTDQVSALDIALLQARQVQRHPLAPFGYGHRLTVHLERTHTRLVPAGQHPHGLPLTNRAGDCGAGHHDPVSFHYERPVYRQSEVAGQRRSLVGPQLYSNLLPESVQTQAGDR